MLKKLAIANYALINELSIDFHSGFSVITGETGAGKSILLGALGLVFGERADSAAVKNKADKTIIEAEIDLRNFDLKQYFNENQLDYHESCIIRRELTANGRSRSFVNDTPVNLAVLQKLSSLCIDIHSQNESQQLKDENYQIQLIDAFSSSIELQANYKIQFKLVYELRKEIAALELQLDAAVLERDFLNFNLTELLDADLESIKLNELEEELSQLNHAEEIQTRVAQSVVVLQEADEAAAITLLRQAKMSLQPLLQVSKRIAELYERIQSAEIEIKDIAAELEDVRDTVLLDPERASWIATKLDAVNKLLHKHRKSTVEELIQLRNELDAKVMSTDELEQRIVKNKVALEKATETLQKQGAALSEKRKKNTPALQKVLLEKLNELGMPHAQLIFQFDTKLQPTENGLDAIYLLFSANKGMTPAPVQKIASGGEISRLMLAIKGVLSKKQNLPTLIFDEIDTGVSGVIATKMGKQMVEMAENMQVISITHLPQVAAQGAHHYQVVKQNTAHETLTSVRILNNKERIDTIASMLSGEHLTESALQQASQLLGIN